MKYIGCCLNGNVVSHLYYADDLVLLSPTVSGMNEWIASSVWTVRTKIQWREYSALVLYVRKVENQIRNFCMMNDTVINMESSCRYMGHMIAGDLDANDDIKRQ